MSEHKLKPCPFCGVEGISLHLSRERDAPQMEWQYQIVCDATLGGCGCSGSFSDNAQEAIKAWNRRANNE